MGESRKPKIFISYSHKDIHWKDYIKRYFNKNSYDIWDDGRIKVGDNWYYKISDALKDCDIALLLLSADFINSDFINDKELPIFFNRYEKENLLIVKVFLLDYPYEDIEWITKEGKSLQGYISPNKPLGNFIIDNSGEGLARSPDLGSYITKLVSVVKDAYNTRQYSLKEHNEKVYQLQESFEKDYRTYSLDRLKSDAKECIDDKYWSKIEYAISHRDLIKEIDNINKTDIFLDYLTKSPERGKTPPQQTTNESSTQSNNNIFVHFRQHKIEDDKYEVDIFARYEKIHLNKTLRGIVIEDVYSKECQKKFVSELRAVSKKGIPVHFIVPPELYTCNFRLWKDSKEIIELFHPVYVHSDTRYSESIDEYQFMIEEEWNTNYIPDALLSQAVVSLSHPEEKYGTRSHKIGVCYEFPPTNERLFDDLDIAQIALYPHNNPDNPNRYIKWIGENFNKVKIKDLPDKLEECEYVSLIWDDMNMLIDLKKAYGDDNQDNRRT